MGTAHSCGHAKSLRRVTVQFVALIIGAIIIVAAIRNTHAQLFGALGSDLPAFMVWAAAILAVGALGWIPGIKPVSRGLLALVILVLVMNNYQAIIAGFSQSVSSSASAETGDSEGGGLSDGLGSMLGNIGLSQLGGALGSSLPGAGRL
jgi:hypothetical protein